MKANRGLFWFWLKRFWSTSGSNRTDETGARAVAGIIAMPLVFVSIWIKLRYEEKLMLQKFSDEYAAYERRVKRLIPFIL